MNSAERYKVPSIGLNLPEIGQFNHQEIKKDQFKEKQIMVNPAPYIMQKHSINHQSLAERDLSNLRGRDQNGNSISISQVLIGGKSILDDNNYISAKDTPIKPEITHNVTMLKRNTYQTVIKESDSHDYVNHHTKKHS